MHVKRFLHVPQMKLCFMNMLTIEIVRNLQNATQGNSERLEANVRIHYPARRTYCCYSLWSLWMCANGQEVVQQRDQWSMVNNLFRQMNRSSSCHVKTLYTIMQTLLSFTVSSQQLESMVPGSLLHIQTLLSAWNNWMPVSWYSTIYYQFYMEYSEVTWPYEVLCLVLKQASRCVFCSYIW